MPLHSRSPCTSPKNRFLQPNLIGASAFENISSARAALDDDTLPVDAERPTSPSKEKEFVAVALLAARSPTRIAMVPNAAPSPSCARLAAVCVFGFIVAAAAVAAATTSEQRSAVAATLSRFAASAVPGQRRIRARGMVPLAPLSANASAQIALLRRCLTAKGGAYARGGRTVPPYVAKDEWQNSCDAATDAAIAHDVHWKARPWVDWRWTVDAAAAESCAATMASFYAVLEAARPRSFYSASPFCAAIGKRSIAFVGDSMSFEAFSSLVMLGGSRVQPGQSWDAQELRFDPGGTARRITLCGGAASMRFIRNNDLTLVAKNGSALCGKKHFCRPWLESTLEDDVVVLNRGAHVYNEPAYESEMRALAKALATRKRAHQLVVWRTTPMGHGTCGNAATTAEPRERPRSAEEIESLPYQWARFETLDAAAIGALKAEAGLRGRLHVIDAATMSERRQDRHQAFSKNTKADCLHYCLPSTIDDWSRWLLALLAVRGSDAPKPRRKVKKMRVNSMGSLANLPPLPAAPRPKARRTKVAPQIF